MVRDTAVIKQLQERVTAVEKYAQDFNNRLTLNEKYAEKHEEKIDKLHGDLSSLQTSHHENRRQTKEFFEKIESGMKKISDDFLHAIEAVEANSKLAREEAATEINFISEKVNSIGKDTSEMSLSVNEIKDALLLKKGNPNAVEELQENMRGLSRWMKFWNRTTTGAWDTFTKIMVSGGMLIFGYGVISWIDIKKAEIEKLKHSTINAPSSVTIEVAPGESP